MKRDDFGTLQRGDVIEVYCGREIRIFTVVDKPHSGNTMLDAISVEGTRHGIYFRDVIGRVPATKESK